MKRGGVDSVGLMGYMKYNLKYFKYKYYSICYMFGYFF